MPVTASTGPRHGEQPARLPTMRLLVASAVGLIATGAIAQSPVPAPTFAAPVRLMAGDKFLGHNRLYPSPVLHDLDGDGKVDLVVGDLRGHLTVAPRTAVAPFGFGAEQKVHGADGKVLDFANW